MKKLTVLFFCFLSITLLFAQDALSAEDYAVTFFKKLNDTQAKLTYLNKKSSLEKVGTETINGNISGTLFYDVKVKGLGAIVTLRYTNYCDEEGWVFNGEIITHSNMAQNGNFEGVIKISGVAPGEVCYDKVLMKKGAPGEGFYLVTIKDSKTESVKYTAYQKSKE